MSKDNTVFNSKGDKIYRKIQRLANTLSNHVGRGNTLNGIRSQELVDRYTDLAEEAKRVGVWDWYCKDRGYSTEHDAYDFFA